MNIFKDATFIKFIVVGCINTLVGTAIMFIVYNVLGGSYWLSTFLNYFIGSIVSYLLNKYYTFKQIEKSFKELLYFIVHIAVCYYTSYYFAAKFIRYVLQGQTHIVIDNVSMLVGMVLFVVLNFFGQKFFVFKKRV